MAEVGVLLGLAMASARFSILQIKGAEPEFSPRTIHNWVTEGRIGNEFQVTLFRRVATDDSQPGTDFSAKDE